MCEKNQTIIQEAMDTYTKSLNITLSEAGQAMFFLVVNKAIEKAMEAKKPEQPKASRPQLSPEDQKTHDEEMGYKATIMLKTVPRDIAAAAAHGLAEVAISLVRGELNPEDIPPTADELLVLTFSTTLQAAIDHELLGIIAGAR